MIAKALLLEYISLTELRQAKDKKGMKREFKLVGPSKGKITFEDEEATEENGVKWQEWCALFTDLLDLYINKAKHKEASEAMFT